MDKHETTADIIAWLRKPREGENAYLTLWRDEIADRLEAAHKREAREAVTDCNQLREALVKARRFIDSSPLVSIADDTGTIARGELCAEIDAALAARATAEKSSAVGNASKLREAVAYLFTLIDMRKLVLDCDETEEISAVQVMLDECRAALAAPPRNCDRFATLDEARKAHEAICEKYVKCHNGCPLNNEEHYSAFDCFEAWLFATATEKEGGDDENE